MVAETSYETWVKSVKIEERLANLQTRLCALESEYDASMEMIDRRLKALEAYVEESTTDGK